MPGYTAYIPNTGMFECSRCHFNAGGGGPRNLFGRDVGNNVVGGIPIWEDICPLDSDNDGATNGEELADPMCAWRFGQPSPPGTTYDPANASSTPPPSGDAGVADMGVAPDSGAVTPDGGASPDTGASPDAGETMDSGSVDSGTANDAGAPADAGAPDLGTPGPTDAGIAPDSGSSPADAGVQPDVGGSMGGPVPVEGEPEEDSGGCTCMEEPKGRLVAWALLPLGLLALRRRRR